MANLPRLYCHTSKAIRAGTPRDRLYLVVAEEPEGHLIAWKCDQTCGCDPVRPGAPYTCGHKQAPKGKWFHPAFARPMTMAQLLTRGNILKGRNGSEPTAAFKPDSFYELVTV